MAEGARCFHLWLVFAREVSTVKRSLPTSSSLDHRNHGYHSNMTVSAIFLSPDAQHLYFTVIRAVFIVSMVLHCISLIFLVKFTPNNLQAWRRYMLVLQVCQFGSAFSKQTCLPYLVLKWNVPPFLGDPDHNRRAHGTTAPAYYALSRSRRLYHRITLSCRSAVSDTRGDNLIIFCISFQWLHQNHILE